MEKKEGTESNGRGSRKPPMDHGKKMEKKREGRNACDWRRKMGGSGRNPRCHSVKGGRSTGTSTGCVLSLPGKKSRVGEKESNLEVCKMEEKKRRLERKKKKREVQKKGSREVPDSIRKSTRVDRVDRVGRVCK